MTATILPPLVRAALRAQAHHLQVSTRGEVAHLDPTCSRIAGHTTLLDDTARTAARYSLGPAQDRWRHCATCAADLARVLHLSARLASTTHLLCTDPQRVALLHARLLARARHTPDPLGIGLRAICELGAAAVEAVRHAPGAPLDVVVLEPSPGTVDGELFTQLHLAHCISGYAVNREHHHRPVLLTSSAVMDLATPAQLRRLHVLRLTSALSEHQQHLFANSYRPGADLREHIDIVLTASR